MNHADLVAAEIQRYRTKLYGIARLITRNGAAAEDVLQETFVRAVERQHQFRGKVALSTWLYSICRNAAKDRFRFSLRRDMAIPVGTSVGYDPEPISDLRLAVRRKINKLPKTFREVMKLRFVDDLDNIEIARRLGLNRSAVAARISRALDLVGPELVGLVNQ